MITILSTNTVRLSITLLSYIAFFIMLVPSAYGYKTTEQKAVALDENTTLYTISFEFGHEKYAVGIPSAATFGATSSDTIQYAFIDTEGTTLENPDAYAFVVSKTSLASSFLYETKPGWGGQFTLAVILNKPAQTPDARYRLHVTHLPFFFDQTRQLQLNPSELQYYVTPAR